MVNVVPLSGFESTLICPLCLFIILWTTESPSPLPICLVVKNGSNILSIMFNGIPLPSSLKIILTKYVSALLLSDRVTFSALIFIFPPSGIASTALCVRLSNTCAVWSLSAFTGHKLSGKLKVAFIFLQSLTIEDTVSCTSSSRDTISGTGPPPLANVSSFEVSSLLLSIVFCAFSRLDKAGWLFGSSSFAISIFP